MLVELEVERIQPCPRNKNYHSEEKLQGMMATIKAAKGKIFEPITVHPVGPHLYEIIDGECRWKAVKQLGYPSIESRVVDVYDELTVDLMRLTMNKTRSFDFLAECQEFANLHRQGKSTAVLTREFGESRTYIKNKVSLGYFPNEILHEVRKEPTRWSLYMLTYLLPLRQLKPGMVLNLYDDEGGFVATDYSAYSYEEVQKAVELINQGEIKAHAEVEAYVAKRRLELEEAKREEVIRAELEARLTTIAEETAEKISAAEAKAKAEQESKFGALSSQLEQALQEARKVREEKAELAAKHPQEIQELRQELSAAHAEELRKKDEAFSQRLDALQKEVVQARKDRDQALERARKDLSREFEQEKRKLQALADTNKTELEKRQALLAELQEKFDQRIAAKEQEIRERFLSQLGEKEQAIQNLQAERERFSKELKSLESQADAYAREIAKLNAEHQEVTTRKEQEIASKDREVQRLLSEIEKVHRQASSEALQLAEEEAQKRALEYKAQFEKEYDERKRALETYFKEREEKLTIKTEKTVDDALNHFVKVCGQVDASMRLIGYDLVNVMREDQLRDVLVRLEWLNRKILEVARTIQKRLGRVEPESASVVVDLAALPGGISKGGL